ncbi:MAG: AAA family ATPase [Chloroflexi bacterium]|nr:AAA family ATPase [Chloroflexota bacterium]
MTATVIAFFNNKGGVGKTSLVYHLAWMYVQMGARVVAADLDPQANLTAAFLEEDRLEELWQDEEHKETVFGSVRPLLRGVGDIGQPHLELLEDQLALLVGDLSLSLYEDQLSEVWPKCMSGDERAFRVTSAFWRILQAGAQMHGAELILMDLGPNLGAINRAALIAADYVVVPLSPDLFSLQGLRNLGPTFRSWRREWNERFRRNPASDLVLPPGGMQPIGYVVQQHSVRLDRPVRAYDRWIARIPKVYRTAVLDEPENDGVTVENDPHMLALLKHYRSLMPMAQEARKPMFLLKPADGAIGAHYKAVQDVYQDFKALASKITERTGVPTP